MRRIALLLLSLVAGCRIGEPEPTPLSGPAPTAVLVLPPRNLTVIPDRVLQSVVAGADTALRERGYRALALAVGFDLARAQGLDPAAEPTPEQLVQLKFTTDVDAVLIVEVHAWQLSGRPLEQAAWDLDWRLVSTHGGGELWRHHEAGAWQPPPGRPLDPTRAPDAEREVQPFGGGSQPNYRDSDELALALHRTACAYLPARR